VNAELVSQGLDLMIYGMGTVFTFLTALVILTTCMSLVVNRFFPETSQVENNLSFQASIAAQPVSPKVLNIIQEAVDQHRAKHK